MKKAYILQILSKIEIARALDCNPSIVTRMPDIVPDKYQKPLIKACKARVKKINEAMEKIKEMAV